MTARLTLVLAAAALAGCATNIAHRSQQVKVTTEPAGADVWVVDSQGHRTMGRSPTAVMTSYEVEETEFFDACWVAPALMGAGTIGGVIAGFTVDEDEVPIGVIIGVTYGLMTLAAVGGCLAGKDLEGEEPIYQTLTVGASLPDREDAHALVQVPGPDGLEVRLYLPPRR